MLTAKELLSTPTTQLGRAGRFMVFQIKMWTHCWRLLGKNRAGQQAAALAYHTIFGIIPLAIVMLLFFQSLPAYSDVGVKVKTFVYEQLNLTHIVYPVATGENVPLTEHLDKLVAKFFTGVSRGSVTILSLVIVIWAARGLLSTIERAFNNIWHVTRQRNFFQRLVNYWAILTLGPLLLGVGIYVTTRFAIVGQLHRTVLVHFGPAFVSYLISAIAFFLLYFVLPNTRVRTTSAIWGAMVAALVWTLAKWLFTAYVIKFIPYSQVYGILGLIPLSVFWIYATWLIVLFGLQLTFTTQHLKSLDSADIATARRTEEYFIANDLTAINILREVAAAFEADNAPIESEIILSRLDIPGEFGEKVLGHLVNCGLIAKTAEPKVGYLPARDPANITLADIAAAVAKASFAQTPADQPQQLGQIARSQTEALSAYTLKQILADEQDS